MRQEMPWRIGGPALELTEAGRQKIELCVDQPARRVGGGRSNVCLRFPSQKMGCAIQCESRHLELPCAMALEYDPDVLEYYDQPFNLKVSYAGPDGRSRSHYETPDYYVRARDGRHCLVECKPNAVLEEKARKSPSRYCKDLQGNWTSPAGKQAAAELGFDYRLFTEDHVSFVLSRNIKFLLDYMRPSAEELFEPLVPGIQKKVEEFGSVRLDRLIESVGATDPIYYAILHQKVIFSLDEELLVYPEVAWIHADQAYADLHRELKTHHHHFFKATSCHIGDVYDWRNSRWRIVNLDAQKVDLLNESGDLSSLNNESLQQKLIEGDFRLIERTDLSDISLDRVSSAEIDEALYRLQWVNWFLRRHGSKPPPGIRPNPPSQRTLRRWVAKYQASESALGRGVLGLLPKTAARGNRTPRLDSHVEQLIAESIEKDFNTSIAPSILNAYGLYTLRAKKGGYTPVCYETYRRKIRELDNKANTTAREGWKAGYQLEHPTATDTGMPVHGDRPWEIAHIDHTQLDILVVSAVTGQVLGKPWLTLLIDACGGVVLAFSLSLESPSYRSAMIVLRACVQRHERFPDVIVCDQGSDFNSRYFEQLLSLYSVTKQERPGGQPRQGASVERAFGTITKGLIHSLPGNTKANKHGRAQTRKTHAPELHASLTLDELQRELIDALYEVYAHRRSKGTLEAPAERMERLLASVGERSFKRIRYDENFIRMTLPAPKTPTRKFRTNRPITVTHIEYFGDVLRKPEFDQTRVPVKYDPYDISYIYIEVDHQWHRLETTNRLCREYLERGILFAHDEIGARGLLNNQEIRVARNSVVKPPSTSEQSGNECSILTALGHDTDEHRTSDINDVTTDVGSIQWKTAPVYTTLHEDGYHDES